MLLGLVTMIRLALLALPLLPSLALAGHLFPERHYQQIWCDERGGQMEVRTNGVRVDCLTDTQAVEHDFAQKYRDGIIQALEYAAYTGKRAVLVLICEKQTDERYVKRARIVRDFYRLPVDIEVMRP